MGKTSLQSFLRPILSIFLAKTVKKRQEKPTFHFSLLSSHFFFVPLHPLSKKRAFSSAGLEHLPYKQRVGGSNPSTPTRKVSDENLRLFLCCFRKNDYLCRAQPKTRSYDLESKH